MEIVMNNTDNTVQFIAVSRLEKSPLNVRRTVTSDGIGELKASILAHGLMQNLVVTDAGDGKYRVIAGGRRLTAIHSLQEEGNLPKDFAVPCQVVTEEHASEMSLAENTVRLAMHPADQFEAFAELIGRGHAAADVATRFGVEESLVLKRMKLALVAPELLQEYRNDGMTLECLMAYTVTDDHRRQMKVFKSLQDWQKDDPTTIRAALTEKMIDATSKLARFVGIDAYTQAGGTSRSDLFSNEVYLEKPSLLNRLAKQKLDGMRRELEAEGWGWIEINPERDYTFVNRCSRLQPRLIDAPGELLDIKSRLDGELTEIDKALDDTESDELLDQQQAIRQQLDEIEGKLSAFIGFDAGHMPLAGCFVSIGHDGTPFIDKGLVKPEHRKQLAKLLGTDGGKASVKPKGGLSEALLRDLAVARLQVAQVEISRHPLIAFDLLVFQVAGSLLGDHVNVDIAEVQFRLPRLHGVTEKAVTSAAGTFADIAKALPLKWLKPQSEAARFEAFQSLSQEAKLDLLAYCVASTLKPKRPSSPDDEIAAYDIALAATEADVASYWRPTKDSYFGRVSREQLLATGGEVFDQLWLKSHATEKKASLAELLNRAFSDPERSGRPAEQVEKLKTWLPAGMAFSINTQPKRTKSKKAKKAA
jgi:ParB family chromosome partitioning protein